MNQPSPSLPSIRSLVMIPAWITLGVTAARLFLELGAMPGWLASSEAGGDGAVVGIVWLPLIFGPYFAARIRPHVVGQKAFLWQLAKTLFAYGMAARIPVVLLSIAAILGEWGTHYEKFPFEAGVGLKILATVGAQLIVWACVWTVLAGTIAALIVQAVRPSRSPATAA